MKEWFQNLRFSLACWALRPYFPVIDIYAPGGEDGEGASVRALIFATDTNILKKMIDLQDYTPPKEESCTS